jgi:hypothetical protein
MRTIILVAALIAGSFTSSLFAACQEPASSGSLEQQLQATYARTLMDSGGYKVAEAGCIFVVQKEGIAACTSTKTPFRNEYEDGQVKPENKSKFINSMRWLSSIPGARSVVAPGCLKGSPRTYIVGEKVYLLRMEIRNAGKDTGLIFSLESCGTCDPSVTDPAHTPYHAELRVNLHAGFLTSTDLKQVKKVVGEVLAFPEDAATGQTQQGSQTKQIPATPDSPQSSFPPIAPPPSPGQEQTAAPVSIAIGQTPEQVKAAMGPPDRDVKLGSKEIYSYKNLKVTFVDGKVSDVR